MKKLKILPSLKERKRYILIEVKAKNKIEVQRKIDQSLLDFLGVLGYGQAGPMLIESVSKKDISKAILSVDHKSVDKVKAAFAFSKIKCLNVSGTLKKIKKSL